MAPNLPGPWELRIFYDTTPSGQPQFNHEMRLNIVIDGTPSPGQDFDTYDYVAKDSSVFDIETWMLAFVDLLKVVYPSAASFNTCELWKYNTGTTDASFYSSTSIGVVGTAGGNSASAGQAVLTFRSQNGGHARINLMESVKTIGVTLSIPSGDTAIDNIAAAVIADDSPVIARDNGYLFNALNYHPGQSEALFKARYRP